MAVLELTLVPTGTEGTSVSKYIAGAYEVVKDDPNIEVKLNPMGTVMQGDIDHLFNAVRKMQETVFNKGVNRVYSVIKIDDRRDEEHSLEGKIESVMNKVGKQ